MMALEEEAAVVPQSLPLKEGCLAPQAKKNEERENRMATWGFSVTGSWKLEGNVTSLEKLHIVPNFELH